MKANTWKIAKAGGIHLSCITNFGLYIFGIASVAFYIAMLISVTIGGLWACISWVTMFLLFLRSNLACSFYVWVGLYLCPKKMVEFLKDTMRYLGAAWNFVYYEHLSHTEKNNYMSEIYEFLTEKKLSNDKPYYFTIKD
ncbi:MAG: hypothetical protein LBD11_00345 [Candidatus Peribacteria bacterium]|jgi:hypothetical protein|nr:hypothetical protein [Candidatus Peribacteria bacterium]